VKRVGLKNRASKQEAGDDRRPFFETPRIKLGGELATRPARWNALDTAGNSSFRTSGRRLPQSGIARRRKAHSNKADETDVQPKVDSDPSSFNWFAGSA
jgi:hypothetical protein